MYTNPCCGMIAMKREVAAKGESLMAGFPWSECQVRKLTTSHCTDNQVYRSVESTCGADVVCSNGTSLRRYCTGGSDTHGKVYSHRLSYLKN